VIVPAGSKQKRVVHQKAKGPIDPSSGLRVRQLREARGMTQGDLAGSDFTKGFISLVETGRTRMSVRSAQIIATRLGVAVADLLTAAPTSDERGLELELIRAEALLARGQASEAAQLAERLERRAAGSLAVRVKRIHGRALVQAGRLREGVRALDDVLRSYRASGDRELVTRTLYDLAQVHARLEEHGEALNLALQAEHLVNEGAVVDRTFELKLLSFLASTLVVLSDFGAADLRAERAKALADDVGDPRATANLYESLAVTRQKQGDFDAALAYARRSLAAYEELESRADVGSAWNTLGWVYISRSQLTRAADALGRAERMASEQGNGRLMSYVLQSQAELEMARGNAQRAIDLAQQSIDHPDGSALCRATSLLVKAQALAKTKSSDPDVSAAFRDAIAALEPHGRRMAARGYQALFETNLARGKTKAANDAAQKALKLLAPQIG
jgi:tetratricopeptide (TPR) repeat protein